MMLQQYQVLDITISYILYVWSYSCCCAVCRAWRQLQVSIATQIRSTTQQYTLCTCTHTRRDVLHTSRVCMQIYVVRGLRHVLCHKSWRRSITALQYMISCARDVDNHMIQLVSSFFPEIIQQYTPYFFLLSMTVVCRLVLLQW